MFQFSRAFGLPPRLAALVLIFLSTNLGLRAQIRDGGIDPSNLGKGDWIYSMTDATNKLGGHITSVTNETSLMLFYKSQGIRYMIVKAATGPLCSMGATAFPSSRLIWSILPMPTAS